VDSHCHGWIGPSPPRGRSVAAPNRAAGPAGWGIGRSPLRGRWGHRSEPAARPVGGGIGRSPPRGRSVGHRSESDFGQGDNAPTVAREFGRWGFRRVYSGQLPNNRASVDARAHLTVYSTVNAPDAQIDTDGWGVCRPPSRCTGHPGRLGSLPPGFATARGSISAIWSRASTSPTTHGTVMERHERSGRR
jgi:hypothetical protein